MIKRIISVGLLFSLSLSLQSQTFPGNGVATNTPAVFARGLVSDAMNNRDFTISPDGSQIFYSIQQRDFSISTIVSISKKNGKWAQPEIATFSGKYKDLEAAFSPDGNRIWFCSNRPANATDTTDDFDIWYVDKTSSGWSEPVNAGPTVNTPTDEFYPSVTRNGNLYFTSQFKNGKGQEDIVMCEWKNDAFLPPVSLPEVINTKGFEYNAFVDPDEQFMLFTSPGRADDMGRGDIYISKKDASGKWQQATNLGANINSKSHDYCPYVTPDKKYFFFSSTRTSNKMPFDKPQNYKTISALLNGAGNGLDDIYWMTADFLK
jgi:Tol biopolymer transport system component